MNEKEFEKQQLEQLLNDLKDIDKYTSFKDGAFIYDLGKYQGSLLVNHINNLQSKIDKANEILDKLCIYGYEQTKCRPIKNTTKQEVYNAIYEIKEILREDK